MKMQMDIIDEQIDTTGRAFMALTIGCARCHDHKFDPIPTADYYSLAGIFKSSKTMENFKVVAKWHEYVLAPKEDRDRLEAHSKRIEAQQKQISRLSRPADREISDTARRKVGAYLLAATDLLRYESMKLQSVLGDSEKADKSGLFTVSAIDFLRGNVDKNSRKTQTIPACWLIRKQLPILWNTRSSYLKTEIINWKSVRPLPSSTHSTSGSMGCWFRQDYPPRLTVPPLQMPSCGRRSESFRFGKAGTPSDWRLTGRSLISTSCSWLRIRWRWAPSFQKPPCSLQSTMESIQRFSCSGLTIYAARGVPQPRSSTPGMFLELRPMIRWRSGPRQWPVYLVGSSPRLEKNWRLSTRASSIALRCLEGSPS